MAVTTQIVTVNETVTAASANFILQQNGALISEGGTTQSTGTAVFYGTLASALLALSALGNYVEITNELTSYFAQGGAVGISILELGIEATVPDGITSLTAWITANPGQFYAYLLPAAWDASGAAVNTFAANYSSSTGKTYFFIHTTAATITAYESTTKAIVTMVPSPTAADTEYAISGTLYDWLSNAPGNPYPAGPMAFRFQYGLTPWVLGGGNIATIQTIQTAFGNVIIPASEGQISNAMLQWGTTMDGNPMMYWYAGDWAQIQAKVQLAAALINASQPGNAPIPYSQKGINSLLAVLTNIGTTGQENGLFQSATFSAIPYTTYIAANPSNYQAGIYNGFSGEVIWQGGFNKITFNLDAVQLAI